MTWTHRRIGMIAALALLAGSFGVITMPNDPAKADDAAFTGDSVYAIVGSLTGCAVPLGMTVVRNGVDDDTVYVACYDVDEVAFISDDSVMGSVSGSIGLSFPPIGLATPAGDSNSASDDTIYAAYTGAFILNDEYPFSDISAIPPGTTSGSIDDSTLLDGYGYDAAVSRDDTVYVIFDDTVIDRDALDDDSLAVFDPGTPFTNPSGLPDEVDPVPATVSLLAYDDTLFTLGALPNGAGLGIGGLSMGSPSFPSFDDSLVVDDSIVAFPNQMAASDDTLFLVTSTGDAANGQLRAIDPRTLTIEDTVTFPTYLLSPITGIAANPAGLVVGTSLIIPIVRIFDGAAMAAPEEVILLSDSPVVIFNSQAVTRSGVIYVGTIPEESPSDGAIVRITKVTPSLDKDSGESGTTVELTLTPSTAPNVTVDDSTVTRLSFGGTTAVLGTQMTRTGNTFTFDVPDGCGTVDLDLELNGVLDDVDMGTWTYPACPSPAPAIPPGAPTSVEAVAVTSPGSELPSASVSWVAPASSGSFPITQYQVTGSPSGSCLVAAPETACEVPGLEFETEYTFTVRALSGAGWGAYSQPSNAIRPVNPDPPPVPTIIISGTRAEVRGKPGVLVTGQTTGFAEGTSLVPWLRFPGQTSYQAGSARPETNRAGAFSWQRRTGKKIYVSVRSFDESIKSNRVIIPAAGPRVGPVRQPEPDVAQRDLPQVTLPSRIRPGLPMPVPLPMLW